MTVFRRRQSRLCVERELRLVRVLRWANEVRARAGYPSLTELPKGWRKAKYMCPVDRALRAPLHFGSGVAINGRMFGKWWVEVFDHYPEMRHALGTDANGFAYIPDFVARFAKDFNRRRYPDLIASPNPSPTTTQAAVPPPKDSL